MKYIKLTQGKQTIVDNEDYQYLSQWKWQCRKYSSNIFYAVRRVDNKSIYLHRELMNFPKGKEVDHKNGDGLDNRRDNLRVCSHSENTKNKSIHFNNKSGFKGVTHSGGKWKANIYSNKKFIYLGSFLTKELAAMAYNQAAQEEFGKYAKINTL